MNGILRIDNIKTKIAIALGIILIVSTLFYAGLTSNAASSSDSWSITYIPNASASVSNQSDTLSVAYYSGGYVGNCTKITGANGRGLTISSSSAGGMSSVSVTSTGKTKTWKMYGSTDGNVSFLVKATVGYTCTSTGTISINN